ncbi:MAG: hypothetical protein AUI14_04590 [Actinobacteria bacterium 13_2_20CM_2_71_6]|nr:MAG: hypothetical protein AUI14_04590 [Actinobacteria bacterium 13_2_20CM_2_71_6]
MPATFPSHAAAILPLKLWRPAWFDGVALVIGSTAPDLGYPLVGLVPLPETHSVPALLYWNLPVTLVLCWLVRRSAPGIAVHLPARWFALPDYGALARVRHRWYVTVSSALIGAASHLLWDGFTHYPPLGGWAARRIPALSTEAYPGWPWWYVLQHVSTLVGGMVAVALFARIGRQRLIRRWHGDPPPVQPVPDRFWVAVGTALCLYAATWPVLPYPYAPHVQVVRVFWALGAGLATGGFLARWGHDRDRVPG